MKYSVKTIQKIGARAYEGALNNTIGNMSNDGWKVKQILGSPDQGFVILFEKE